MKATRRDVLTSAGLSTFATALEIALARRTQAAKRRRPAYLTFLPPNFRDNSAAADRAAVAGARQYRDQPPLRCIDPLECAVLRSS